MSAVRKWLDQKGWSVKDLHSNLNAALERAGFQSVKYELVRRWTLPLDHQLHRVPAREPMAALLKLAAGAFTSDAFYAPLPRPRRRPRSVHVSIAASRKAAATRRRQAELRA